VFFNFLTYKFDSTQQRERFIGQLTATVIPTLNRQGIACVGAFEQPDRNSSVCLLLPHQTIDNAVAARDAGLIDIADFRRFDRGIDSNYATVSSFLLRGIEAMPGIEVPTRVPTRVFQLRTYESPSETASQKKLEMFHQGELEIFRRVGLAPVFFAETLFGTGLPSLTYMLSFDDMNALKTAWDHFVKDSAWQEMSNQPDYSDDVLIRSIRNEVLFPIEASQM